MKTRHVAALVIVLLAAAGCTAMGPVAPPVYFGLDYPAEAVPCAATPFEGGVRVWPLTAVTPYDREDMVLLAPGNVVRFAQRERWVSLPGSMISARLLRDLAQGSLFPEVVTPSDPVSVPFGLSGQIFRFAWEEGGAGAWRAVLECEVSLWREGAERKLVFRKAYALRSADSAENRPEAFSRAASDLVAELSRTLRRDLCAMREGSSSRSGG